MGLIEDHDNLMEAARNLRSTWETAAWDTVGVATRLGAAEKVVAAIVAHDESFEAIVTALGPEPPSNGSSVDAVDN